jgi:MFS family permease
MIGWGLFQLSNGLSFGSAYAIIQEIVPPRLKGRATALWYLVNSLGTSLGTLVTALGTDYLFKDPEAIPQAIQIMAAPAVVLGISFMWFGLKPFDRARHAVQAMR